jgi:hypothetical protein
MLSFRASFISAFLVLLCVVGSLGQVFSPNVKVDEGLVSTQYAPKIIRGNDAALYVIWVDTRDGNYDIYFSRSDDGGRTWLAPNVRISDVSTSDYGGGDLAIDTDEIVYATWYRKCPDDDYHIFFAKSLDRGITWTPDGQVDDGSDDDKYQPEIAIGPTGINIVWRDFRPYDDSDIYFARSTDGGETWTNPSIKVHEDSYGHQRHPGIGVDPWGTMYVVYESHEGDNSNIYLVKSVDGGETWSWPHVQVDDDRPGNHYFPELAVDQDGMIYASWSYWGGDHILFAKSTDGGESWSRLSIQVDYAPSNYFWNDVPSIAVDEDGNIYVTWEALNSEDAYLDVFCGMSTDGGDTWTNPSVRVNDGTYLSQSRPAIASGDIRQAYIVWRDSRGGWDIAINGVYFSRTVPVLAYGEAENDTVASGGNLVVTITLVNTTGVDQTADIWTGMMLLTGGMYRKGTMMYGPEAFALALYDTFAVHIDHEIPGDTPLGEYEYWIKVDEDLPIYDPPHRFDTDEDRYYLFKDSFTFTVVEGRKGDAGRLIK